MSRLLVLLIHPLCCCTSDDSDLGGSNLEGRNCLSLTTECNALLGRIMDLDYNSEALALLPSLPYSLAWRLCQIPPLKADY